MHVNADVFRQLPHRRQRISLPDTLCGNSDDDLIPQLNVKGLVAVKVNLQYHRLTIFRYICYIEYITFQIVPSSLFLLRSSQYGKTGRCHALSLHWLRPAAGQEPLLSFLNYLIVKIQKIYLIFSASLCLLC